MQHEWWLWASFFVIVATLVILDLGVFNRRNQVISLKSSLWLTLFYFLTGCAFGGWIGLLEGYQSAALFFTGFLVEKSLSLDNLFVISLIFASFHIPREYQHRTLFWGIIGVIVLRGVMIGMGTTLVREVEWVLYLFGAFLVFSGFKLLKKEEEEAEDISGNAILNWLKRRVPVTPELHGDRFFVRLTATPNPAEPEKQRRVWRATPLFLCLLCIEVADIMFAVDSIPAILAITTDPFLVYTSNLFAILGLRALYFALSSMLHRLEYLHYALALVLIFIGSKIFVMEFTGWDKFPAWISLSITVALLVGGALLSLWKTRRDS